MHWGTNKKENLAAKTTEQTNTQRKLRKGEKNCHCYHENEQAERKPTEEKNAEKTSTRSVAGGTSATKGIEGTKTDVKGRESVRAR